MSCHGGVQPVAILLKRHWVKGLSEGMPATEMTMTHLSCRMRAKYSQLIIAQP